MSKKHCKVVTLRSGKELENTKINSGHEGEPSSIQINEEIQKDAEISSVQKSASTQNIAGMPQHSCPDNSISKQPPPFPERIEKQNLDSQFKKFLAMLKHFHINIPLVEALEEMPNYVKFMKDVLTRKRRLDKLPPKLKDPGSFSIPCTIGDSYCGMALCDLGASINLMPMSVFKKLGIGEVRPATITLQLGDRFLAHPDGIIKDVLVREDKLKFNVDFIVQEYKADREVPIILVWPFLIIGSTLIDLQKGEHTMRVQDEKVTFNVLKAMKFQNEVEEWSVVDSFASKEFETRSIDDPLERLLLFDSQIDEDEEEYLAWLEANSQGLRTRGRFDSLELSSREFKAPKPPIEEPPELELKILLEDSEKFSIEGQRRLNPIMKEVVKKEIIKWLDARIIYPISDSSWVSLIQCVPKKGGITVVKNEYNELIPTRTIAVAPKDQHKTTFICHMEGIVLGHKLSKHVIEVDRAKTEVIEKLPHPNSMENIRSFLGHVRFYRQFIKDFFKISKPLCNLLEKDTPFHFDESCLKAFEDLKSTLVSAPIIVALDWDWPFELMCDASDFTVGVVIRQGRNKVFHSIYYASPNLTGAQLNYIVTEKELLSIVIAFDKFSSYLVGTNVIVYTDHSAIKYLIKKKDVKPLLIRWVLFLQEFDV
ncbi:uncharacterized protein LOC133805989 [Humulus lupulus]|uniref:uncharacterized protein LOC133805989 n=1 Tax=Humulus lupulus TaxID=3486 RepID=UPI002B40340E|nr:uncharacterized protein LOC133805989 [Humulus lupulus]